MMRARRHVVNGLRGLLCALVALWVADVVVNIEIVRNVLTGTVVHAGLRDYFGLLVAETQIAVGVVLFGWVLGLLVAVVFRSRDAVKESVALSSAMLAALTVVIGAQNSWNLPISSVRHALPTAAVTGVLAWGSIRLILSKRGGGAWSTGGMIRYFLFPALIAGVGSSALAAAARGYWRGAVIDTTLVALLLVIVFMIRRLRSQAARSAAGWLPAGVVLLMVFYSVVAFASYGKSGVVTTGRSEKHRPTIIFIVLDTVRADHLKRYGYARDTMPALEKWSENALVFERAITPSGWTSPAHASFFSGLTVSQHGVHYGRGKQVYVTSAFEGVPWLPELLSAEGYYCLAVTANPLAVGFGMKGFDRMLISQRRVWYSGTMGGLADHYSPLLERVSERLLWRIPYLDSERIVDIVTRAAPRGDGPVFLFVNVLDAHAPYNPPSRALKLIDCSPRHLFGRYRSHRELTRSWPALPDGKGECVAGLYDGELRWIDLHIGRLLDWIDERYGSEAVVVVTSDHGEELGEEGRVGHEHGLHQRLLHVPLMIRSPTLPVGEITDIVGLGRLFDFMYLCGTGKNPGIDVIVDAGEYGLISERYPTQHDIVSSLGPDYGLPWVSTFEGGYKAVGPSENMFALFDIESSGFDREVEVEDPPHADSLRTRIDDYWTEFKDRREEGELAPNTDELRKKLRSLGYIR